MCDLVQIVGSQDFFPDHFIKTTDTLDILGNEYEDNEQTDQLPDNEDIPVCRSSSCDIS
jgi:hypothetical protein